MELGALRRVAVYEEPNNAFAVGNFSTPADFLDVPAIEGSITFDPGRQFLDRNLVQQHAYAYDGVVQGWRRPTITFRMHLSPTGIAANAGTASPDEDDSPILRILKAVFGGLRSGEQGSTIDGTPSSAAIFDVAAGHGTRFAIESAVGLTKANGAIEVREIHARTGDGLTLKHRGSFTPAASSVVLNSSTVYLTADPDTSLQFMVEGADQDERWGIIGCQCTSIAFDLTTDQFPTVEMTFQGVEYEALTPAAITVATYSGFAPQWRPDRFFSHAYTGAGDLVADDLCVQERTFNPGVSYMMVDCAAANYGVDRWKFTRGTPPEVTFTLPAFDGAWWTAADAGSYVAISQQFGTDPGRTVTIAAPYAQVVNATPSWEELSRQVVTLRLLSKPSSGNDRERSPFRIHFV